MKKEMRGLKNKYLQGIILSFCIIIIGIFSGINMREMKPIEKSQLDSSLLEKTDKLMIVAHPDDEMIWGGGHLLEGGYLVVCITNGENETRKAEFLKAVEKSGNIPLILSYPDKELGMRSRWIGYIDDITRDIQTILALKEWNIIVTHNLDGEYGHIHHKIVSALVTGQIDWTKEGKFYYFGKYYNEKELSFLELEQLPENIQKEKEEILKLYSSQNFIWEKFGQMFPYENWEQVNFN